GPAPLRGALELAVLERSRSAADEEALGLDREPVAVLPQPLHDPVRGRADEQLRLVRTRVEDGNPRTAAQRQLVDPPAHTDPGLAGSALLERALARLRAGKTVDVGRRADHEQVDVRE